MEPVSCEVLKLSDLNPGTSFRRPKPIFCECITSLRDPRGDLRGDLRGMRSGLLSGGHLDEKNAVVLVSRLIHSLH